MVIHSTKKKFLIARLKGLERMNPNNKNSFHYNLENQLTTNFNTLLYSEEEFWKLKSRIQWLNEGDANTKLFHFSTIHRRKCNRILSFHDTVGNWTFDNDTIHQTKFNHFQQPYTTQLSTSQHEHIPTYSNSLTSSDIQSLQLPLSTAEIFKTVHFLQPLKTYGPDGLHPIFC